MKVVAFPAVNSGLFPPLVNEYLVSSEAIELYTDVPFTDKGAEKIISSRNFDFNKRSLLVSVLSDQYSSLNTDASVEENIEALRHENCFTVTTGHQLCLGTGPMYFVFKILSAIQLAGQWNQKFPGKKFVPVYWMASEDHDFEEINHLFLFGKKISWENTQSGSVGRMSTNGIIAFVDQVSNMLGTLPYTSEVIEIFREAMMNNNLSGAMRFFVNALFGKYGLVIIDADDRRLKHQATGLFSHDLFHHNAFHCVTETNSELKKNNFHSQVNPREINLFFLDNGSRNRFEQEDDNLWRVVGTDKVFRKAEIEQMLDESPEVFSPNVILRPAYQEITLPNVAYIGGPGELSYWMQLRSFFNEEKIPYPLLVLRDHAFLITQRMQARMNKVGITPADLLRKKQDVLRLVIERSGVPDLTEEKERLIALFATTIIKAKSVDATLEATANADLQKQLNALDVLEKKIFKAVKNREEIKVQQVEKIWHDLFPGDAPQERSESILSFYAMAGPSLFDNLLSAFDPMKKEYKVILLDQ
ncbi:MAG: bacillithiol biosynthesis cysteine-adding enzyme BshC [Crocinitomicaceae bacterium]|nr:bacillithiol biosynthesis cysteine-adding enzyme BshC [Crocinitomicaceae bacterium]